jgi:hypothetical protein
MLLWDEAVQATIATKVTNVVVKKETGTHPSVKTISRTERRPRAEYIRQRVALMVGLTAFEAMQTRVPGRGGGLVRYRRQDLRYDTAQRFLKVG